MVHFFLNSVCKGFLTTAGTCNPDTGSAGGRRGQPATAARASAVTGRHGPDAGRAKRRRLKIVEDCLVCIFFDLENRAAFNLESRYKKKKAAGTGRLWLERVRNWAV